MRRRLQRGASGLVRLVCVVPLALALALAACGGPADHAPIATPAAASGEEWPAPASSQQVEASDVKTVLASADGAKVVVRAYLVAVTLPCPSCNTSLGQGRSSPRPNDGAIGRARPPVAAPGPGCAPCPAPAATISDDPPMASAAAASPVLRAVGAAEGLQQRHVGHVFLLTGTFHAKGGQGPELEVTDVRAVVGR